MARSLGGLLTQRAYLQPALAPMAALNRVERSHLNAAIFSKPGNRVGRTTFRRSAAMVQGLMGRTHTNREDSMATNVDQQEISKFEQVAGRWWDPESEFKPLHDINPLRLEYIDQHASLAGKRTLDVGCGGGILSEAMAARGARVTGIDLGEGALNVARLHGLESGIHVEYRQTSAEELAETEPASFDVVTCLELLEHVPDPSSVVSACAQLVKPDGHVFFSTMNRNPKSWLLAIVAAEYVLRLLPAGTHEYRRLIRPSELSKWARSCGLTTCDMIGLHYNPVSGQYWLGPGVDVNYLSHCRPMA